MRIRILMALVTVLATANVSLAQQKPNILVIMGDDIGYWNISAYNRGMMATAHPTSIGSRTRARF